MTRSKLNGGTVVRLGPRRRRADGNPIPQVRALHLHPLSVVGHYALHIQGVQSLYC